MVLQSEKREGSQEGLLGVGANILAPEKTSETLVSILVQLGFPQTRCYNTLLPLVWGETNFKRGWTLPMPHWLSPPPTP